MTVGDLKASLQDPMLYDHSEVVIRIKEVTADMDDEEVETLSATIECTGKRVLVINPADSLVLLVPNKRITHL